MKQRIITATVALALFLPIVIYGKLPLVIVTYIIASVGLFEILRMRKLNIFSIHGLIASILLWLMLIPQAYNDIFLKINLTKIEFVLIGVLLLLAYTVFTKNKFTFDDAAFVILSVFYIGFGFYYLIETRDLGLTFVFYSLFIVFATDTGAYFTGRSFGKNKLAPHVSPNKTIEGAIGGVCSALVVALIFLAFTNIGIPYAKLLIITIVLSCFGQIGDLVESALKRHYEVKDSGRILPGHGGVLDRFDSLLFVLPLLNFLI